MGTDSIVQNVPGRSKTWDETVLCSQSLLPEFRDSMSLKILHIQCFLFDYCSVGNRKDKNHHTKKGNYVMDVLIN